MTIKKSHSDEEENNDHGEGDENRDKASDRIFVSYDGNISRWEAVKKSDWSAVTDLCDFYHSGR